MLANIGEKGSNVTPMADHIAKLKEDELLRPASMMALVTIIAGAMDYAYQVYMGRALGPEKYGDLGSLFALFYIGSVLRIAINYNSTNYVSRLKRNEKQLVSFLKDLLRKSIILAILLFSFFLLISNHLTRFLKIDSPILMIMVSLSLSLFLIVPVNRGALRGMQRFKLLAMADLAQRAMKLISGIVLVTIGFGVFGAMAALPISTAFAVILTAFPLLYIYKQKSDMRFKSELASMYRYTVPLLMVAYLKTIVGNLDLLFVKVFFSSYEAGLYAAVSILGKILFFLPGGISIVFFPQISERHADDVKTKFLLRKGFFYITVLVGTTSLVYIFFPYTIINIVFGPKYLAALSLVRWYALTIMVISINSILLDYNLAKGQNQFIYAFSLLTILQLLLFWLFHATLIQIIQIILMINLIALAFGFVQINRKGSGHLSVKTI